MPSSEHGSLLSASHKEEEMLFFRGADEASALYCDTDACHPSETMSEARPASDRDGGDVQRSECVVVFQRLQTGCEISGRLSCLKGLEFIHPSNASGLCLLSSDTQIQLGGKLVNRVFLRPVRIQDLHSRGVFTNILVTHESRHIIEFLLFPPLEV